jgi:outer membrane lipoprotein-sorting protein
VLPSRFLRTLGTPDRTLPVRPALFTALAALALGLVGCAGSSETTAPGALPNAFPNHSAEEIRTAIQSPTDTLERFSADARVTVRTPSQNRSFNADIRQQRADSLFMRFSLFGFEGGRMLMTPDSVFMYDSRKQMLRVGPIADAQAILPAPVASGEVFANLLGLVTPDPGTDWTVTADSAHYYLANANETRRWTVDPRRWRVVQYKRQTPDGDLLEVRKFSAFKTVQGLWLPHSVTFRRPVDDASAQLDYRSIALNPSGLSYDLGVPSTVPRKPIRSR